MPCSDRCLNRSELSSRLSYLRELRAKLQFCYSFESEDWVDREGKIRLLKDKIAENEDYCKDLADVIRYGPCRRCNRRSRHGSSGRYGQMR